MSTASAESSVPCETETKGVEFNVVDGGWVKLCALTVQ